MPTLLHQREGHGLKTRFDQSIPLLEYTPYRVANLLLLLPGVSPSRESPHPLSAPSITVFWVGVFLPQRFLRWGDRICSVHLASHIFVGRINGIS